MLRDLVEWALTFGRRCLGAIVWAPSFLGADILKGLASEVANHKGSCPKRVYPRVEDPMFDYVRLHAAQPHLIKHWGFDARINPFGK